MTEALSFWPFLSHQEGSAVDQAVRSALAVSLRTVYAKAVDRINFDEDRLEDLLRNIRRGPVRPAVFGLYADLVESLISGNSATLEALSHNLFELDPTCNGIRIAALTDGDLGIGQSERYARLIDDDPDRSYPIQPLESSQFQGAYSKVSSALRLLDEGVPELAEEIRGLVREIVLVTDAKSSETRSFDGASTFYLWGAVLLNVEDVTRLDLAQQIAHEAAHLLLFGLMMGQPLTANGLEDRYLSPRRQDPRPMEGVVHAAYVLARMSYALERLLGAGTLSVDEQEKARLDLATHRNLFFDTLPVILRHARFKPGGNTAFWGAIKYMRRESELGQVSV